MQGVSPPGYATSCLRPANQLRFSLYANAIYRISLEVSSLDKANNVAIVTSFEGSKK